MLKGLEAITDSVYLNGENARFSLTETGLLQVSVGGEASVRAYLSLAFPFETREGFICVQNEEKEEIGMIRSLSDLEREEAELLKNEIEKKYFAPRILKIRKLTERFGNTYWDCDTDKGPLSFTVKDTHRSLIRAGEDRLFVVDHDGCRYEIESVSGMDKKSHSKIELYL